MERVICITDVHGYLRESVAALNKVLDSKIVKEKHWKYTGEDILVLNGDMIDRGPENREALQMALDLCEQENVIYNMGNHEFFAAFPKITENFLSDAYIESCDENGMYWRDMTDRIRKRLLENIVSGNITVGYRRYDTLYVHAGVEDEDLEEQNQTLKEIGKKLLKAFEQGDYEETQTKLIEVHESDNGAELRSSYELFRVERTENCSIGNGGPFWRRFEHLNPDRKQVVGHTRGPYLGELEGFEDLNPQRYGKAVNINTVRDFICGNNDAITVSIESVEGLELREITPDSSHILQ